MSWFNQLSLKAQGLLSLVALILHFIINSILEAMYVSTTFPVTFFEGQTSFNAQKVKERYSVLLENGRVDSYWNTQFLILSIF